MLVVMFLIGSVLGSEFAWTEDSPANPKREYQIKASLIFNFLQFVKWPSEVWEQKEPAHEGTLRICLYGKDNFGKALEVVTKEIVDGKRLEVAHVSNSADLTQCQVLFFERQAPRTDERLNTVAAESVLTIGESPDFLEHGGIVNLLVDGDRIVFDINRAAALNARLEISSKLLRIARRVAE